MADRWLLSSPLPDVREPVVKLLVGELTWAVECGVLLRSHAPRPAQVLNASLRQLDLGQLNTVQSRVSGKVVFLPPQLSALNSTSERCVSVIGVSIVGGVTTWLLAFAQVVGGELRSLEQIIDCDSFLASAGARGTRSVDEDTLLDLAVKEADLGWLAERFAFTNGTPAAEAYIEA